jgi:hypothetical protein
VVCLVGTSCEETSETGIDDLEISASQCQDSIDNDGDGATDCADTDCQGFVFCVDGSVGSCDCDGSVCSDCCDDDGDTCDDNGDIEGCLQGSFRIENELDMELLNAYSCMTGYLTIIGPGFSSIDLPNLKSIGGNFQVLDTTLQNLDGLSSLETVDGSVTIIRNDSLVCNAAVIEAQIESGYIRICDNAPGNGCGPTVCP